MMQLKLLQVVITDEGKVFTSGMYIAKVEDVETYLRPMFTRDVVRLFYQDYRGASEEDREKIEELYNFLRMHQLAL